MINTRKNQLALLLLGGLLMACSGKDSGITQSDKGTAGFVEIKSESGTAIGMLRIKALLLCDTGQNPSPAVMHAPA